MFTPSDALANPKNPVPNSIPKPYVFINDSYMTQQLFNLTKGTPLQGSKTQLVNPPVAPALLIPAPR